MVDIVRNATGRMDEVIFWRFDIQIGTQMEADSE